MQYPGLWGRAQHKGMLPPLSNPQRVAVGLFRQEKQANSVGGPQGGDDGNSCSVKMPHQGVSPRPADAILSQPGRLTAERVEQLLGEISATLSPSISAGGGGCRKQTPGRPSNVPCGSWISSESLNSLGVCSQTPSHLQSPAGSHVPTWAFCRILLTSTTRRRAFSSFFTYGSKSSATFWSSLILQSSEGRDTELPVGTPRPQTPPESAHTEHSRPFLLLHSQRMALLSHTRAQGRTGPAIRFPGLRLASLSMGLPASGASLGKRVPCPTPVAISYLP